jgi:hypothetical protein
VLSRKLQRPAEADSLFWVVVRQHPGTEAQLAARDYLEQRGATVPADLIKLPEPPPEPVVVDSFPALTHPPDDVTPLGVRSLSHADSLRLGGIRARPGLDSLAVMPPPPVTRLSPRDSMGAFGPTPAPHDTVVHAAPRDTSHAVGHAPPAPRDTTHASTGAPRDTSHAVTKAPSAPRDTSHTPVPTPPDTSRAEGADQP